MKPFEIKVCNKILYLLRSANISPDDACLFFSQQIIAMQSCEPNYTSKNNKQHLRMSFDSSYWVMRGFYPNLPVMFKIVMVDTSNEKNRSRFYGKVSLIQPTIQKNHNAHVMFNEKLFAQVANDKANNILVGDTQSEPKVLLTQRHPKCMSPKGCTVFNLRVKD